MEERIRRAAEKLFYAALAGKIEEADEAYFEKLVSDAANGGDRERKKFVEEVEALE